MKYSNEMMRVREKMIFLTRDIFRNNIYNIYNNFKTH